LQHFKNLYVSHSSTARFLRGGEKYIYFAYNSKLFPTVKNFQNRLTVDEVTAKSSTSRVLKHSEQYMYFVVCVIQWKVYLQTVVRGPV